MWMRGTWIWGPESRGTGPACFFCGLHWVSYLRQCWRAHLGSDCERKLASWSTQLSPRTGTRTVCWPTAISTTSVNYWSTWRERTYSRPKAAGSPWYRTTAGYPRRAPETAYNPGTAESRDLSQTNDSLANEWTNGYTVWLNGPHCSFRHKILL